MTSFPDRQASYEKLYHTLDVINDQEAERCFMVGAYYKRVGKVPSAEYYFGKLPQRWPNSPWAVKAKTELAQLAKMPRKPSVPSKIMTTPGALDPYYSAGPMGGMGGMGGGMGGMGGGMGGMGGMGGNDAARSPFKRQGLEAEACAPGGAGHVRIGITSQRISIIWLRPYDQAPVLLRPFSLRPVGGCGYSIRAPFDKNVKTVFVPIFKTQSFRRDLNTT